MNISVYNFRFIKDFKQILLNHPSTTLVLSSELLNEIENHFKNLLNSLNDKYSELLNESNIELLNKTIDSLTLDNKIDLCIFFKLKYYFNPKLKPSLQEFCSKLGIVKGKTINNLIKRLTGSSKLVSNKLTYPLKINCSNCNHSLNASIDYLGSSNYSITKVKCSICNHVFYLEAQDFYIDHCIRNDFDKKTSEVSRCNCKACTDWRNNFSEYIYSNITIFEDDLFNSLSDGNFLISNKPSLEQLYKIHKNSLTKTENELLSLTPLTFDDINLLLNEMFSRFPNKNSSKFDVISNLLRHGVIYKSVNNNALKQEIKEYTKNFLLLADSVKRNEIIELYHKTNFSISTELLPPYEVDYCLYSNFTTTRSYVNLLNIYLKDITEYNISPYYLNGTTILNSTTKRYSVFNSNAEVTLYNNLKKQYKDYNINPNVSLITFINVDDIRPYFSANEIKYLKYCIIDFVITDAEGFVIKCIELQKGKHHDTKDWIYKDNLKKRCFEYLGIDFSYEY